MALSSHSWLQSSEITTCSLQMFPHYRTPDISWFFHRFQLQSQQKFGFDKSVAVVQCPHWATAADLSFSFQLQITEEINGAQSTQSSCGWVAAVDHSKLTAHRDLVLFCSPPQKNPTLLSNSIQRMYTNWNIVNICQGCKVKSYIHSNNL